MMRPVSIALLLVGAFLVCGSDDASAQRFLRRGAAVSEAPAAPTGAYNQSAYNNGAWGKSYSTQDWNRFYHYPYIYYPQNFYPAEYYRSADNMYYRYPVEMQIPVYNRKNFNYYAEPKPYHHGFHYIIDVF